MSFYKLDGNTLTITTARAYILQDSEAKAFIVYAGFAAQAIGGAAKAPSVSHVIVVGDAAPEGTTSWESLTDASSPERAPVRVSPGDIATICYTSGTTGPSKGAMLTHRNFVSNCEQLDRTDRGCAKRSDVLLLVLPLFHIYAMNCAMNAFLRAGATIVLVRRFDPLLVLEQIQKHRCCKEHLATFKVPCLIKFRDELPKLPTGKVLRRVLRDEARQLAPAAESHVVKLAH